VPVDALKKEPASISFGHNGSGTNGDLAIQMIADATKAKPNAIPFKGTSAQKTDLLGGHLDIALVSFGEIPELHGNKPGHLKALAQLGKSRSAALPQTPTGQEAGVPVVMSSERGFAVPKAVPNEIVQKLETAIGEALRDPEFAASSPGDAPVVAFLPGAQWQDALNQNRKSLQALADRLPK
jgi:tripartite-type tricarboxylate transporter receptor subunit TctC